MKDKSCPICYPQVMGLSPEGWIAVQEKHEREHMQHCDKCGQPLKDTLTNPNNNT